LPARREFANSPSRPAPFWSHGAAEPASFFPTKPPDPPDKIPKSTRSVPVRRLRVGRESPQDKVAESIVIDLTQYGAAEATAAREGAVAVMTGAMVKARGALLKKGYEVAVMPSLERAPPGAKKGADGKVKNVSGGYKGWRRPGGALLQESPCPRQTSPYALRLTHTDDIRQPPTFQTQGPLVVVNRLVVSDLPPVSIILPNNLARMGKSVERARRTLAEKSRLELVLPAAEETGLFEALAGIGTEPIDATANGARREWPGGGRAVGAGGRAEWRAVGSDGREGGLESMSGDGWQLLDSIN
jgi:hypothetical protein